MRERMLRGELYIADDPESRAEGSDGRRSPCPLQRLSAGAWDERDALLRRMLRRVGEGAGAGALYCEYGAISIGDRTFVNVDAVMLDIAPITIGAACQIATRVSTPDRYASDRP